MKISLENKRQHLWLEIIIVSLLVAGLLSACAQPPTIDSQQITVQTNEFELLKQQQQQHQQALLEIEQRLDQLQQKMGESTQVAGDLAPSKESGIMSQTETAISPGTSEVETLVEAAGSYLEAFSALAMGRYEQAQDGFNSFLNNFVEHRYAPNARYWLAEAEIALGLTQQAEDNLLMIINDPASERKAPEALSRLAQLYEQQNLTEQVEDILHQLRTRFPESREAQHFNRSDQVQ
jgi:tol-pal system protein YbgF